MKRIPSLDGLRAVSISLVLFSHLLGIRGFLPSGYGQKWTGDLGNLGVRIFFIISGYLISTLLLREVNKTGDISIRNFYWRRAFRILPPSYLFLAILLVQGAISRHDMIAGLTYSVNYPVWPAHAFCITHLWSLSVEEQFYLLWPSVIKFAGMSRAMICAAAVVLVSPLARSGIFFLLPHSYSDHIGHTFETTADAIACGCLMAAMQTVLGENARYRRMLASPWMNVLPPAILALNACSQHPRFAFLVGYSTINVLIALYIHHLVLEGHGVVARLLNSGPMVWMGTLSYSIYLWQQVFLNPHQDFVLASFPWNIGAVLVAACASYYLVERWAFWFRDHVQPIAWRQHRLQASCFTSR